VGPGLNNVNQVTTSTSATTLSHHGHHLNKAEKKEERFKKYTEDMVFITRIVDLQDLNLKIGQEISEAQRVTMVSKANQYLTKYQNENTVKNKFIIGKLINLISVLTSFYCNVVCADNGYSNCERSNVFFTQIPTGWCVGNRNVLVEQNYSIIDCQNDCVLSKTSMDKLVKAFNQFDSKCVQFCGSRN